MIRILLLLLSYCSFSLLQAQTDEIAFPYSYQDKFGLVSTAGDIILEPTYNNIGVFQNLHHNDFTIFFQDGKYGILDKTGQEVIPANIDRLDYDGNGGFVWYYEDHPNMLGLKVYSLEAKKVVAAYENERAWEALGTGPYFLWIKDANTQDGFVINTEGTPLFEVPNGMIVSLEYPNSECPLFWVRNTYGVPRHTYYECTGTPVSLDDYYEKYEYEAEEEMPDFVDQSVWEEGGTSTAPSQQEIQTRFPELKIKKLVLDQSNSLVSIIARDQNQQYGLIDVNGNELMPFEFSSIVVSQGYLRTSKYAFKGLHTLSGKEVFPTVYGRIEYYPQDHGYFRVYTHTGYMGYGTVYGKVYLPKDTPLK
jgi:hypothetical protein